YNSIWKPVFEADEDTINYWNTKTTLGRLQRINLETFLYAYLHIKINDPALNISAADKSHFRSADDLFNQYKLYLRLSNFDLIEFALDLTNYAKLYREYINSNILDEELPREWGIERLNALIFGLDTTTMIPYVLYVLKNQSDISEIKGIAKVLEAYVMRRIICKSGNDNYSDLFSLNLISNQVLSATELIDYLLRKQGDSSLAMPNDDMLHYGIMESVLTNPRAKGVLYFLESVIRDEYQSTTLKSFNSYSLEHLLPKKWNPSIWPLVSGFDAEDRNQRLKTLGNLSILPIKLNTSISNKSWDIKKNGNGQRKGLLHYASGIETLSRWLQYPFWNENKINERAEWIFNLAYRVWQFGPQYHQSSDSTLFGDIVSDSLCHNSINNSFYKNPPSSSNAIESDVSNDFSGRDRTKYSLDNSGLLSKRDFVFSVIKKFVTENPNVSFDELKTVFPDSIMEQGFRRKGLIVSVDSLLDGVMTEEQLNTRYYFNRNDRCLKIGNTEFFVNNQHTRTSADNILSKALELGYNASSTESVSFAVSPSVESATTNATQKKESTRLKITLPNGNIIEKPNAIDTLTLFILQIGIERVADLGITCYNNYPLLTTSFINHKLQKKIGNRFYLFKNSSTTTKKQQIEEIIRKLNLAGITLEIIPKSQSL
ncbi:MAG: HNH endonuclease family protein, partial [Muribaculaceae bacterium]|nr:HNH endonuclease family protein [Muribaculaceae bacterium]